MNTLAVKKFYTMSKHSNKEACLKQYYIDGKYFAFCDWAIIASDTQLPIFPLSEEEAPDAFIKLCNIQFPVPSHFLSYTLPSEEELKDIINLSDDEFPTYDWGADRPRVNAKFLLTMEQILSKNAVAYIGKPLEKVIMKDKHISIVLMPVRKIR